MPSSFQKRVFFGHQSVGYNIIDGVRAEFPDLLTVDVDSQPDSVLCSGIFHAKVGENGDAQSKFESFRYHVLSPEREYDLAVMKLCYADVHRCSDIDEILSQYISVIKQIQLERPRTKLLHTTVPLRSIRLGARSYLKKWMGRRIDSIEDNLMRHSFNESIRRYFGSSHQLFDLARFESTTPFGVQYNIRYRGAIVPSLCPAYSADGGHLNGLGRSVMARQFISVLQSA